MSEYIEREKAIAFAHNAMWGKPKECEKLEEVLRMMPADDVAPVVHGKWEECDFVEPCVHGFGTIRIPNAGLKCTRCCHVFKKKLLWSDNYCPHCGAKMDGEE